MSHGSPIKQRADTCHSRPLSTGRARARLTRHFCGPPHRQCLRKRRSLIIPPDIFGMIFFKPVAATTEIHPLKPNPVAKSP